jgi:HPt (histidine-containing phosphotransfer) domain-containing protein
MLNNLGKRISGLFVPRSGPGTRGPQTLAAAPEEHADELRLDVLSRKLSREVFVQLLVELPTQRRVMHEAHTTGNYRRLRDCVHRMLGAAAYCDAPELEDGLRELHRALKTGHAPTIERRFRHAIREIDSTLDSSGYRAP